MIKKQRPKIIITATVVAITSAELYMIATDQYKEAIFLSVGIVVAWGMLSFIVSKKTSQRYFQQEILRYLYNNNKKGKREQIIEHFHSRAGDAKPEAIKEIVTASLRALESKSKIAVHNNKIRVT